MRFYRIISFLLAVTLITIGSGCGRFDSTAALLGVSSNTASLALPVANLDNMAYFAEQVFYDYSENPPRAYHERVWVNSNGQVQCICTAIFQLIDGEWVPCPESEVAKYNSTLKDGRPGSRYLVYGRGFRIKDPILFLENYNYSVLHANKEYLDRTALVVRITSKQLDRPSFTVWLDKKTGFVLKYTEDTPVFDPLYRLEVTHLDFTPDFSGVEFSDWIAVDEEISFESLAKDFEFDLYMPLYQLPGFEPLPAIKRTLVRKDGNVTTLQLSFTDGLNTLSMFQNASLMPNTRKVKKNEAVSHPSLSTKPQKPLIISPVGPELRYVSTSWHNISKAGSRSVYFQAGGTALTIRSKVHEEVLSTFIQSLVPIQE